MSTWKYDQSTEKNLLKRTYGKHIDKQFNEDNILYARVMKKNDLEGDGTFRMPVEQSIGGGVSAGSLGQSSRNQNLEVVMTSKDLYAVVTVGRKSMKLAKSDKGSFVRFTKYPVKTAVRAFNRNLERMLTLGDLAGSGLLASIDSVTGTGTEVDPYVIVVPTTTVMEQFEEGDLLHLNTDIADTDAVEIVEVDVDASSISVIGQPSVAPAAADDIYMQKSKDQELSGLQGILKATTGTYNNVAISRRWKATQKDAAGQPVTTALINDVMIKLIKTCGEKPTMALASFEQYQALLDLHEDQKVYNLPAREAKYKTQISFEGIEIMTAKGRIPVIPSRFVPASEIYFLNDAKMYLKCTEGGFEWFDEDGTVFLREANADAYGARYGGYVAFHVNPHFQAILFGLAVPA